MKYLLIFASVISLIIVGLRVQPAQASGGETYVVQAGDTLSTIAASYGIDVHQLATANGLEWNAWVYVGQQLLIPTRANILTDQLGHQPGQPPQPAFIEPVPDDDGQVAFYDSPPASPALPQTPDPAAEHPFEDLTVSPWIEVDLTQHPLATYEEQAANFFLSPSAPPAPVAPATEPSPSNWTVNGEKWIDVDLTTQTLTAYEGQTPVFKVIVSTGTRKYPTVVGTYEIYVKFEKARMRGGRGAETYDLPDVPYVMYFHRGYGLHGTYWHNNFGTPMSHGCVNLSIPDAEWLFNWASVGTRVVTHY